MTKSNVLVCWLGYESLQAQCLKLVTQLWSHGVAADLVYENQELDSLEDIQVVHTTCYMWYQTLEGEKRIDVEWESDVRYYIFVMAYMKNLPNILVANASFAGQCVMHKSNGKEFPTM